MLSILFDFDLVLSEIFFLHLSLYTNLVFMTALCYLLLRYTLTLTSFVISSSRLIFELWSFWYPLIFQLIAMSGSPYLVETFFFRGLEGCYSLYRTFLISNLIPEPRLRFFADSFSKKSGVHLGVLFLLVFLFKNK